uniref:Uncharacterized protein n=1 Tax=Rousettus aegyptiacus TaxID=9407 RepID=A0A7J8FIW4_ROUAE|nr:hypothetical protein HJG63_012063 [Rousettus aegyptiacus]
MRRRGHSRSHRCRLSWAGEGFEPGPQLINDPTDRHTCGMPGKPGEKRIYPVCLHLHKILENATSLKDQSIVAWGLERGGQISKRRKETVGVMDIFILSAVIVIYVETAVKLYTLKYVQLSILQ